MFSRAARRALSSRPVLALGARALGARGVRQWPVHSRASPMAGSIRHASAAADFDAVRTQSMIRTVLAALEDGRGATSETFVPQLNERGGLELDLGDKGWYTLEAAQGGLLLLFSPLSGPKYYEYDEGNDWWVNREDGHLLAELLVRELMHITSVCVNL